MKKMICILICLSMVIFYPGCSVIKEYIRDKQYVEEITDEIIRCFNEGDAEGLKELFCQNAKDGRKNLDTQIENMFEYYEGICTSDYYPNTHGGWMGAKKEGEWVSKKNVIDIQNVITDKGKEYDIGYSLYIVYDDDPGRIGISGISLKDKQQKELASVDGFTWND